MYSISFSCASSYFYFTARSGLLKVFSWAFNSNVLLSIVLISLFNSCFCRSSSWILSFFLLISSILCFYSFFLFPINSSISVNSISLMNTFAKNNRLIVSSYCFSSSRHYLEAWPRSLAFFLSFLSLRILTFMSMTFFFISAIY